MDDVLQVVADDDQVHAGVRSAAGLVARQRGAARHADRERDRRRLAGHDRPARLKAAQREHASRGDLRHADAAAGARAAAGHGDCGDGHAQQRAGVTARVRRAIWFVSGLLVHVDLAWTKGLLDAAAVPGRWPARCVRLDERFVRREARARTRRRRAARGAAGPRRTSAAWRRSGAGVRRTAACVSPRDLVERPAGAVEERRENQAHAQRDRNRPPAAVAEHAGEHRPDGPSRRTPRAAPGRCRSRSGWSSRRSTKR